MPEYLSPGVYIEEIDIGSKPIEGVSTSNGGFLGETERGPTTPGFVTSWLDFQRKYGSYFDENKYLPYAVDGFFANGGQRCYIARIIAQDAQSARLALAPSAGQATIKAVGEGSWGNRIAVKIEAGTFNKDDKPTFRIRIFYWKKQTPETLFDPSVPENAKLRPQPDVIEDFDELSLDPESPDSYEKKVNNGISKFIELTVTGAGKGATINAQAIALLTGGENGGDVDINAYKREDTNFPGKRKGLTAFEEIDEINIVYAPNSGVVNGLVGAIINHCEKMKERFAIIDANQGLAEVQNIAPRDNWETKYAAYYYPWIKINDPVKNIKKTIPPGGHVAGIYARTDTERGVFKAPANEVVRGAVELEFPITKGEHDILNPRGVNVIRFFPGRGIRVWGARTLSSDSMWKYINVRRLFLFLEESIEEGTQWVVFEPNDQKLWARVRGTITGFLTTQWRDGALFGATPEEAFFVKCDDTTMTPDDIDNGKLIVMIGVCPVRPAEFVIFRIAQLRSGWAQVSE